jgi:hypothetical protein
VQDVAVTGRCALARSVHHLTPRPLAWLTPAPLLDLVTLPLVVTSDIHVKVLSARARRES